MGLAQALRAIPVRWLSWKGRTPRLPYFLIVLAGALCTLPCVTASDRFIDELPLPAFLCLVAWSVFWSWMTLAASARRCRDAGGPAWLSFLCLVPGVNFLFALVLAVKPSRPF